MASTTPGQRRMRRKATMAALGGAASLVLVGTALAASFGDGNFETPRVSGAAQTFAAGQTFGSWTVGAGSIKLIGTQWYGADSCTSSPCAGSANDQSVDLNGGSIYQDIDTTPGQGYLISFYASGDPNSSASLQGTVSFGCPGDTTPPTHVFLSDKGADATHMNWQVNGQPGTPGVTNPPLPFSSCPVGTTTRLTFSGTPGTAIDAVTVTPAGGTGGPGGTATPELGSGELLATGIVPLVGALLYRRRRARRAVR